MKQFFLKFYFLFLFIGFVFSAYAQVLLPEVVVPAKRYKYLSSVDNKELGEPIKILEYNAAAFDVKSSAFYEDEYDEYFISFYLPNGYILATYDKDGKILRTAERYQNVALPSAVSKSLIQAYPDWSVPKDVYLVNYEEQKGSTKIWKLVLTKEDKRIRVKLNERGEFIGK
jgi:hypothetical protein